MQGKYQHEKFEFTRPAELNGVQGKPYPVVVVGAGPVGLTTAIDLAVQGKPVLLLDDDFTVSIGSRGVAYAKRSLEIFDRLGCGEQMVRKGVSWNVGRTFFGEAEVFNFNLCPEPDHHRPGMINLQQYYLEEFLLRRARELPNLEIRFGNKVTGVTPHDDSVTLQVETPAGDYTLETGWLVAADGARSPIRVMLGLDIEGKVFKDRFLIADVVMKADYPTERWFWFNPPFHPNQSALLHRQADNIWRIDFQLGWQADPEEEKKPQNVIPRIKAMLGDEREFELDWVSVYTFQCRRMRRFNHGRILFVGDSAHQVSPFGGRGANSGIQDADNLVWKLALVMDGKAPPSLLDAYTEERGQAADENIKNSTRSTDFITPKSNVSKAFRNAVLELAGQYAFARTMVNSGRLSVPTILEQSSLNTRDSDTFAGRMIPGAPMADAPVIDGNHTWLLEAFGGCFALLYYAESASDLKAATVQALADLGHGNIPVRAVVVANGEGVCSEIRTLIDLNGRVRERYDLLPGSAYLIRPDQHVVARWRQLDPAKVRAAVDLATCNA
ncbi:FAD-dependent oxidoreductase [Paraburkholderia sp. EG287B]|uniref:FAD-dependent oxidoreductase n=1 Tax=Paraburkholderia sp. EG287B TaxID=3237010 RepID=UPI0034D210B3